MNPWDLDATALMIWGLVAHLIADWPLQNDWMANHKAGRRLRWGSHKDARKLSDAEVAAQAGNSVIVTAYGNTYAELPTRWWDRHPAAYVHAGIHGLGLALVFGWLAAPLALVHLLIDTRVPVRWWSQRIGQTQPLGDAYISADAMATGFPHGDRPYKMSFDEPAVLRTRFEPTTPTGQVEHRLDNLESDLREWTAPAYDVGTEVRFWTDQVFHIACVAAAALIIGAFA